MKASPFSVRSSGTRQSGTVWRFLRKSRSESGQTLLELAFLVPILLLLLVGVIEVGRYAYLGILIGNAARAGAEFGMQGHGEAGNDTAIIAAATNDFRSNGQAAGALSVSWPANTTDGTYTDFFACVCDNQGASLGANPSTAYCFNPFSGGTNPTPGKCPTGQHWVVLVSVTATGTFNSLLIPAGSSFFGIPGSIVINRTSTLRVAPLP
jgi:Flp pilus assembly protein TadG